MIDSHCHLADKQFDEDIDDVILRAEEHGISAMICIADDLEEAKKCIGIAEKYEQIFCTVGVHPHASREWKMSLDELGMTMEESIIRLIESSAKVKAIGEIGLDYFYDHSPRDVQREVFRSQIEIANKVDLPVVIHNRDSIEDMYKIIDEVPPNRAVMHCCTEPWENVQDWVERGYWLSFTGIATYKKSEEIRETIRNCPIDRLMIETDAPYLAPVPHRGKRNEPAFVREVAKLVAELKGLSLQEVDEVTTNNTVEFFGL